MAGGRASLALTDGAGVVGGSEVGVGCGPHAANTKSNANNHLLFTIEADVYPSALHTSNLDFTRRMTSSVNSLVVT